MPLEQYFGIPDIVGRVPHAKANTEDALACSCRFPWRRGDRYWHRFPCRLRPRPRRKTSSTVSGKPPTRSKPIKRYDGAEPSNRPRSQPLENALGLSDVL
jgi:hypothetical protein